MLIQDRDLKILLDSQHLTLKQCRQSRSREDVMRLEAEHMEKVLSQSFCLWFSSVHLPQVIIFCHHPSFTNFLIYGSKPTCSTNPSNHRLSSSSWLLHGLVLHQKPSFIKRLVLLIAFMPLLPDNVGKDIVCRLSCWNIRSFFQSDIVITISHEWLEQFWWNWQWILISPCWWPD